MIKQKIGAAFEWHRKKIYRPIKLKLNLNGYQMSWIAFGKGLLIGAILL